MAIRKVEFKLALSKTQRAEVDRFLEVERRVWNRGLALLEWREWYDKWEQVLASPEHPDYDPEPVPLEWVHNAVETVVKRTKKGVKTKTQAVYGLACLRVRFEKGDHDLQPGEFRDGDWICIPAKPDRVKDHWTQDPVLPKHGKDAYFSLVTAFGKKRLEPDHYCQDVPGAWTKGQCKILAESWKAYKDKVRKRPRYKKRHDRVTTLRHPNSETIKIKGDRLTLPGLGPVKVKGLAKRWGDRSACPIEIMVKGGTVYLQLTGKFEDRPLLPSKGRVIGVDPGKVNLYTDDLGHRFAAPQYLLKADRRLKRMQRKLSRQIRTNSTQVFDEQGRCKKMEFKPGWQRKNLDKTRLKLAKLHDKIARQRRSINHAQSTRLVRLADDITLENLQLRNVTRAVKKGVTGRQNGRKRKSALNRGILDNAIGSFYSMLESKAQERGRSVRRVEAAYTSQTCHECGYSHPENRLSQATFRCLNCGYSENADQNAARNIKRMGMLGVDRLQVVDHWAVNLRECGGVPGGDRATPVTAGGSSKSRSKRPRSSQVKTSGDLEYDGRMPPNANVGDPRKEELDPLAGLPLGMLQSK